MHKLIHSFIFASDPHDRKIFSGIWR